MRFAPIKEAEGAWLVFDLSNDEAAAGPYKTELQATYVAYHLSADPTSCPEAPDGVIF